MACEYPAVVVDIAAREICDGTFVALRWGDLRKSDKERMRDLARIVLGGLADAGYRLVELPVSANDADCRVCRACPHALGAPGDIVTHDPGVAG